jgi:hypothetical protein
MGQKENNLKNEVEAKLTTWQRLWRANSGKGWAGKFIDAKNGILKLANFGRLELFPPGTPDMIGFDSMIITPEMVGQRVAVFVGSELKATKNDKLNKDQRNFKNLLIKMGGIHREHRPGGDVVESGFKKVNS